MIFFVYGTLKRGYGNNRLLKEATFLGEAVTVERYALQDSGVPFVWPFIEGDPLKGEVYDIGNADADADARARLHALDRLESNGRLYQRIERPVRMLTDSKGIKPLPRDAGDMLAAWIYESLHHRGEEGEYLRRKRRWLNSERMLQWEARR